MDAPSRIATVAVRQLTILMALGLLASFWLPWVHLDGQQTPSTGIGLVATLGAPSWDYMMSVSLASAGALIGGPVVIGLFGIIVLAIRPTPDRHLLNGRVSGRLHWTTVRGQWTPGL